MKKSKEYKVSIVISCVALVLFCVAFIGGLVEIDTSIEKICFYLGIFIMCLNYMLWNKSKNMNDIQYTSGERTKTESYSRNNRI